MLWRTPGWGLERSGEGGAGAHRGAAWPSASWEGARASRGAMAPYQTACGPSGDKTEQR